jgi:alpha-1,2-mannosyltransferase
MRQSIAVVERPRTRLSTRQRYTVAIGVAVAFQLAVLTSIRLVAAGPEGGDLCRDIVAAHRLVSGQDPYVRMAACGVLSDLPHPPAYLLVIGPFALLPLPWSAVVWNLFSLLALAGTLVLIVRELTLRPSPLATTALLALLVIWPPLLGTLLEAQISPILLLLLTLAWRSARRGEPTWTGSALGIAGAIRLFPLVAVGYFVLRRDWRTVRAAVLSFAVASLLPLPLVGVSGYVDYATSAAPGATQVWIAHEHNVSLWGFVSLLFIGHRTAPALGFAPTLVRPVTLALLAMALGILAWRTLARRQRTFADDELTFLAYLPAMLLASPLTWVHYFVILLLPIVVLLARVGWIPSAESVPSLSSTGGEDQEPHPIVSGGRGKTYHQHRHYRGRPDSALSVGEAGARAPRAAAPAPGPVARRRRRTQPIGRAGGEIPRAGWLALVALACVEINYLATLPALPDHLPAIYGPALYALPFYALVLLLVALLLPA